MRILIVSDSYKGCLSSLEAGAAMADGVRRAFPDAAVSVYPIADGGEGTADALTRALGGALEQVQVHGPHGEMVQASFGMLPDGSAVLDMASASGLPLAGGRRDPLRASTYGTGELIAAALQRRPHTLYVGLGGSATNDGGAGALCALGLRLLDEKGEPLPHGSGALERLASVDASTLHPLLRGTDVIALSDVDNPLCGPSGATAIFGPQKGVTPAMAARLDAALAHLADLLEPALGTRARDRQGAGAAGGLGFALLCCGAQIRPGIDAVLEAIDFDAQLAGADLVLTGEGRLDGQTARGKAPVGIAQRAQKHGVPVIAIAGSLGPGASDVYAKGVGAAFSIVPRPMSLEECLQDARALLADASERALRAVRLGRQMKR